MVISLCLMLVVDSINSIPLEDNTGIIRPKPWKVQIAQTAHRFIMSRWVLFIFCFNANGSKIEGTPDCGSSRLIICERKAIKGDSK